MALTNPHTNIYDVHSVSSGVTMIDRFSNKGNLDSISICNQHASTTAVVTLYLDDGLGNDNSDVHIINAVSIPAGTTLVLDGNVNFNNDTYDLKITNTGGVPLSIITR